MRAALYLRISRDHTGEELGVSRQREDCLALAKKRDWSVVAEYVENDTSASGKAKRPQFESLMNAIASGQLDVVIAWNLDRLTRNRRDTVRLIEACQEHQIVIALARGSDLDMSTPMGRMMADQLAGWARYEIEQKSDRQKRANAQAAMAGKPHGSRRPYGYEADLVTIRESEAAVLREMAKRLIAGHAYKEIAFWANSKGYPTAEGGLWYGVTVRQQMNRPRYAGIRTYNGAEYPATWDAIFDPATWEQVQLAIKLRSQPSDAPRARKYLLTGLVYCGKCGKALTGVRRQEHGVWKRAYFCNRIGDTQRQGGCGGIRRSAPALEDFVTECLFYRLDTPELGKLLATGNPNDEQLNHLLGNRATQQQRLNALVDDYATGLLTKDQLQRAKTTSEGELKRIDNEIERLNRERLQIDVPLGKTLRDAWDSSESDTWRRSLLSLLIKRITVNGGYGRPRYKQWKFATDLIDIEWLA